MDRIYRNQNKSEREHARRILGWIVCAKRPLRWHEIQGALSIQLDDRRVDFDKRRLRVDMKDLCGSLVDVHIDGAVELVHTTARS